MSSFCKCSFTHMLPGASCSEWLCTLNAFIPMPCCFPVFYQWPYATAQEKALQEGCNSMSFSSLTLWAIQCGKHHCCSAPALVTPQGPDTVSTSCMALEGRGDRQLLLHQAQKPAAMRLPWQAPTMRTAWFPTGAGGMGIYLNQSKQTKALKLGWVFFFPFFLIHKDSHGCEGLSTTRLVLS